MDFEPYIRSIVSAELKSEPMKIALADFFFLRKSAGSRAPSKYLDFHIFKLSFQIYGTAFTNVTTKQENGCLFRLRPNGWRFPGRCGRFWSPF